MDPLTAVGLWLLSTCAAPDAYTRLLDSMRSSDRVDALTTALGDTTGQRPSRRYRRWLASETTWQLLVGRTETARHRLIETLEDAEANDRWFKKSPNRDAAEALVNATIAHFLATLDPSAAVAVHEHRSELRHAELVARLDASTSLEDRLLLLPGPMRNFLRSETVHRGMAERVADALVRGDPATVIASWCDRRPDWLHTAPASIIAALGFAAVAYGLRSQASLLFEEAADLGLDPPRWYARAALEAAAANEDARRSALMERALAVGAGDDIVHLVHAGLEEDWGAVVARVEAAAAPNDPFDASLYALALSKLDRLDDAVAALRPFENQHEATQLRLQLASLLLQRSTRAGTTDSDADRRKALQLAVEARDERRQWRGDSAEAVDVACSAALLLDDYATLFRLGTPPPEGEAEAREVAHPEVLFAAAQAAIGVGRRDIAEQLADTASDFHRTLIRAELADIAGDVGSARELYDAAWQLAAEEQNKIAYWLSASAGGFDLLGSDELRARSDELPALAEGGRLIATGNPGDAVAVLRPIMHSEHVRGLLVDAYVAEDNLEAAIAELREMARRFSRPRHLVRAVGLLLRNDRRHEAADIADDALRLLPVGDSDRSMLHEAGIANAHDRQDWVDMEARVRAWIAGVGATRRRRWLLVLALNNQGSLDRAWRVLEEAGGDLAVEDPLEAQLWISLTSRYRPSPRTLSTALELVDRFPDDHELRVVATNAFFTMGDDKGPIAPEECMRWNELIAIRQANPIAGDSFTSISIPDDPEGLAEAFRPFLERNAHQIEKWIKRVKFESWPYGMLATAAYRPYTRTLAQRPTGFLPVEHVDPAFRANDVKASTEAIAAGGVLVDLSVLVVSSYIRDLWPVLRATFASVEITADSRIDAINSDDQMFPRSNETLGWDVDAGRPTVYTIPDDVLDALAAQLKWIREQVTDNLTARQLTSEDEREASKNLGPWMTSFHAARNAGLALWADDVGLRTLARNEGVPTFGTAALLRALETAGRIDPATGATALHAMRDEYCVDLEGDHSWIRESARDNEWRGGPSLLAISRRSEWLDPRRGWAAWSQIAQDVATQAPEYLPAWVHAATMGILSAVSDEQQLPSLCAGVLVKIATLTAFDSTTFARCEQASTHALGEVDRPRVTELAIAMTLDLAARQMPVDQAAALVARLGANLDAHGREALRRVLFGP